MIQICRCGVDGYAYFGVWVAKFGAPSVRRVCLIRRNPKSVENCSLVEKGRLEWPQWIVHYNFVESPLISAKRVVVGVSIFSLLQMSEPKISKVCTSWEYTVNLPFSCLILILIILLLILILIILLPPHIVLPFLNSFTPHIVLAFDRFSTFHSLIWMRRPELAWRPSRMRGPSTAMNAFPVPTKPCTAGIVTTNGFSASNSQPKRSANPCVSWPTKSAPKFGLKNGMINVMLDLSLA